MNGKQYVGMTTNLASRLDEHNSGRVASTSSFRPWRMVYSEELETRLAAREREKYLKSAAGRRFRKQLGASSSVG